MEKHVLRFEVPGIGTVDAHVHPHSAMLALGQQMPEVFHLGLAEAISRFFGLAEICAGYALDPRFAKEPKLPIDLVKLAVLEGTSRLLEHTGEFLSTSRKIRKQARE